MSSTQDDRRGANPTPPIFAATIDLDRGGHLWIAAGGVHRSSLPKPINASLPRRN